MRFDKLKGRMVEKRVSQGKLAEVIGISTQSFNAKINGRNQFTLGEAVKIMDYLEIENPSEIFFAS